MAALRRSQRRTSGTGVGSASELCRSPALTKASAVGAHHRPIRAASELDDQRAPARAAGSLLLRRIGEAPDATQLSATTRPEVASATLHRARPSICVALTRDVCRSWILGRQPLILDSLLTTTFAVVS